MRRKRICAERSNDSLHERVPVRVRDDFTVTGCREHARRADRFGAGLGQGRKRLHVDALARGRPRIHLARDLRRKVPQPVDGTFAGQEEGGGRPDEIERPERCALECSVVQVEPVDMDLGPHRRPRKEQGPLRGTALEPTACCRRLIGPNLHPFVRRPQATSGPDPQVCLQPRVTHGVATGQRIEEGALRAAAFWRRLEAVAVTAETG